MMTDQQHITIKQAEDILRQAYWNDVRGIVDDLKFEIEHGNLDNEEDAREWLWQTLNGHHRVIYTHESLDGLRWTDNGDAAYDNFGAEGLIQDGNIHWGGIMYCAMEQDVYDTLGDISDLFDVEEDHASKITL